MKALTKEQIIELIQDNFQDEEIIFRDDIKINEIWEQFGDDYFIENNRWVLTKKNENWK